MHDRLKVFALALGCLFVVVMLLSPQMQPEIEYSKPDTTDRGDYGLLGLKNWLDHSSINNISLRRRYSTLESIGELNGGGHLLITSIPHAIPARNNELTQLSDWLKHGNTLMILAAERDEPAWNFAALMRFGGLDGVRVLEEFELEFKSASDENDDETTDEDEDTEAVSSGNDTQEDHSDELSEALSVLRKTNTRETIELVSLGHPLVHGIDTVSTRTTQTSVIRLLQATDAGHVAMPLLVTGGNDDAAFWEVLHGEGRIWISAYPDLFGNITLGEGDNARLLERLIQASVGPDGFVLFDDFHFGLSDLYDPAAFYSDRRLHVSVLFVIAFWFIYVLGHVNRLAPPPVQLSRPKESDFVQAVAGLCARRIRPNTVAQGIIGHFFNEVRSKHRQPENARPAWDLLQQHSRVSENDIKGLQKFVRDIGKDKKVSLNKLSQLLNNIRNVL
jgi:hypothetical protein